MKDLLRGGKPKKVHRIDEHFIEFIQDYESNKNAMEPQEMVKHYDHFMKGRDSTVTSVISNDSELQRVLKINLPDMP